MPDDPFENMLSYFYCSKHLKQYYSICWELAPVLKMFVWGENDFVAIPKYCSEMAYEFIYGGLKVDQSEFLKPMKGEKTISLAWETIERIFGSVSVFQSEISFLKSHSRSIEML